MSDQPIRIGAPADLYCQPIIFGLQHSPSPGSPGLLFETSGVNAERILIEECEAGLIGPVEFARNSSDFSLYPGVGVSSKGESKTTVLCVKRDLRKISTLAIGIVSSSDVVLAKIILSEKFGQEVALVPVVGTERQMLSKADAALIAGNDALRLEWDGPVVDLVDAWSDMTELPFIHVCCAARREKQHSALSRILIDSQEKGVASLSEIASAQSTILSLSAELLEQQLERYSYGFDDEAREALGEFFRYAYYLGVLPDVPEINVFGS